MRIFRAAANSLLAGPSGAVSHRPMIMPIVVVLSAPLPPSNPVVEPATSEKEIEAALPLLLANPPSRP